MDAISYHDFENGEIHFLKDLCNRLMKFQADHARIRPEVMASMNFENRLVPDYHNTGRKYIAVAYDGDKPVGFAFASISQVGEDDILVKPAWAQDIEGNGFYPNDYEVPKTIGTFKLLYVDPEHRGYKIGGKLSEMVMTWLNSHEEIEDLWVFVANGNEKVGRFYEKYGFSHSHSVFGGFIEAYYQNVKGK